MSGEESGAPIGPRTAGTRGGPTSGGTDAFAPEIRFVAACLAWPRGPQRNADLAARAVPDLDWTKVLALSERHRVVGLVAFALRMAEVCDPPWFAAEIQRRGQVVALRELAMSAEMSRVNRRFAAAGITPLVLKGLSVAVQYYHRVGLRQNRDIDLLITPDQVAKAATILVADGYEQIEPAEQLSGRELQVWMRSHKDLVFRNSKSNVIVELHWRLFDNAQLTGLLGSSPAVAVTGAGFHTLSATAAFAYMSVHGSQHAWSRLKWLADFGALCAVLGSRQVEAFYQELRRAGLGGAAAQGLVLCEELLGIPMPAMVRDDATRSLRLQALTGLARRALASSQHSELEDTPFGSTWKTLSHYLIGARPSYWIRQFLLDASEVPKTHSSPLLRRLGPFAKAPMWVYLRFQRSRTKGRG